MNHFKQNRRSFIIYSPSAKSYYNIKERDGFVSSVCDATKFRKKVDAVLWCGEDEEIFDPLLRPKRVKNIFYSLRTVFFIHCAYPPHFWLA